MWCWLSNLGETLTCAHAIEHGRANCAGFALEHDVQQESNRLAQLNEIQFVGICESSASIVLCHFCREYYAVFIYSNRLIMNKIPANLAQILAQHFADGVVYFVRCG